MDWQLICTIIGTVLGGQSVIELLKWFRNRKTEGRIAEAHADSEEFATLSQTNLFLQQQLKDKEERFAEQTNLVRKLNTEVIQITKEKAAVELEFERYKARTELELERVRCNDRPCPWRQPPNYLTQTAPEGMSKEEYHKQKKAIMETIKRGSRGEAVKTLQRALNLLADGIYGPLTEEGVKNFQRVNGLTADGVVGPKTWAKILPGGSARVITGIILHCTATKEGHSATVAAIRNFHVNVRGFSDIGYHFVIYPDGSVHVGRDINISGAHCTGHNAHTIGISYVGGLDANGKPKDTRTPAQKKAIADLVAKLRATYNIPKSNIYGHNEFANKACPCFNVKNEFRK